VLARVPRISGRGVQDHVSPGRRAPKAFICQRREKIPSLQEDGAVGGEAGGNHHVSGRLEPLPPAKSARHEITPSEISLPSLAYILNRPSNMGCFLVPSASVDGISTVPHEKRAADPRHKGRQHLTAAALLWQKPKGEIMAVPTTRDSAELRRATNAKGTSAAASSSRPRTAAQGGLRSPGWTAPSSTGSGGLGGILQVSGVGAGKPLTARERADEEEELLKHLQVSCASFSDTAPHQCDCVGAV
jgi:hypothetical protein